MTSSGSVTTIRPLFLCHSSWENKAFRVVDMSQALPPPTQVEFSTLFLLQILIRASPVNSGLIVLWKASHSWQTLAAFQGLGSLPKLGEGAAGSTLPSVLPWPMFCTSWLSFTESTVMPALSQGPWSHTEGLYPLFSAGLHHRKHFLCSSEERLAQESTQAWPQG